MLASRHEIALDLLGGKPMQNQKRMLESRGENGCYATREIPRALSTRTSKLSASSGKAFILGGVENS